jgi:hypothetical protein
VPPGIVPKLAENAGFVRNAGEIWRETDSLLEGTGFELPVRGRGQLIPGLSVALPAVGTVRGWDFVIR